MILLGNVHAGGLRQRIHRVGRDPVHSPAQAVLIEDGGRRHDQQDTTGVEPLEAARRRDLVAEPGIEPPDVPKGAANGIELDWQCWCGNRGTWRPDAHGHTPVAA